MTDKPDSQRLFFALWPDQVTVEAIRHRTAHLLPPCGGRAFKPHNLHITLAFIGQVPIATRDCMQQATAGISGQAFELSLSQLGFWKKPKVVWLAPQEVPAALQQLQLDLSGALVECGYQPEVRAFKPHLTLMRKARCEPKITEIEPIPMPVSNFVLVCSETHSTGVEYKIIQSWPLGD